MSSKVSIPASLDDDHTVLDCCGCLSAGLAVSPALPERASVAAAFLYQIICYLKVFQYFILCLLDALKTSACSLNSLSTRAL